MMVPGSISAGGDWVEPQSMARAIEESMVADGILSLEDETEDAMKQRRKSMIALAKGIIAHITAKAAVSVTVPAGGVAAGVPNTARTFSGTVS